MHRKFAKSLAYNKFGVFAYSAQQLFFAPTCDSRSGSWPTAMPMRRSGMPALSGARGKRVECWSDSLHDPAQPQMQAHATCMLRLLLLTRVSTSVPPLTVRAAEVDLKSVDADLLAAPNNLLPRVPGSERLGGVRPTALAHTCTTALLQHAAATKNILAIQSEEAASVAVFSRTHSLVDLLHDGGDERAVGVLLLETLHLSNHRLKGAACVFCNGVLRVFYGGSVRLNGSWERGVVGGGAPASASCTRAAAVKLAASLSAPQTCCRTGRLPHRPAHRSLMSSMFSQPKTAPEASRSLA